MAFIYKITNDINQKVYIGKTERSIEERFKEHCRAYNSKQAEKRPLYSAMKKYGIEHFHVELVEETDNPEEREQYWIKFYNSYGDGYNATMGGDSKRYIDYDEIIKIYQEVQNINKTAKITGHCAKQISQILKNANVPILSSQEISRKQNSKSVVQTDKQNNFVAEFSSATEAGRSINKPNTHINACCNHKRQTAYGYKWYFAEEYYSIINKN